MRRSRLRHAARRAALVEALERELGERADVLGANAGLHVLVRLPERPAPDVRRPREALDALDRRAG